MCGRADLEVWVGRVEVRYQVPEESVLLLALEARGIHLSEAVHQDDQVYFPAGWNFGDERGVSFPRLRTVGGRHFFAVRRPTGYDRYNIEHETEVADRGQMHQAILRMGFNPAVHIVKTRRTVHLPEISLHVDSVVGLGVFLKLTRKVAPRSPESAALVRSRLVHFAADLGVEMTPIERTYEFLAQEARQRRD